MHALFTAGYLVWIATEVMLSVRTRARSADRRDDRGSHATLILVILGSIALAIAAAGQVPAAAIPAPRTAIVPAGVAVMLLGIAFRTWSVETLGRQFRMAVTLVDDHRLVERGPYARIRHPSYTGALATMVGFGLSCGNWLSLVVMALLPFAAFRYRIAVEERVLARHFGPAWLAYRARTGTLLPRLG